MAKGRAGLWLEAWKFSLYVILPIGASVWYNDPERQKAAADYWQFVKYPPNPNTNMKEKIEALAKSHQQREVYLEQLKELDRQAARTASTLAAETAAKEKGTEGSGAGWLRWIGLGRKKQESNQ